MLRQVIRSVHPSWVFYAAVCGVTAGIVVGVACQLVIFTHLILAVLAGFVILLSLRFSTPLTATIAFLAGFVLGSFRIGHDLTSQSTLQSHLDQTVIVTGTLAEDPDDSNGTTAIRLQNLRLFSSEQEITNAAPAIPGVLYVTLSGTNVLERSDQVALQGKLSAGFGNFIGKMARPELLSVTRSEPGDIFAKFKHWFANLVRGLIPSPEVDLGLGYLMGMKSGLPTDFAEALRAVGMTHVVVASGAHLAILTTAAKKVFGRISKFAGLLFSLLLISGFVMIVGFTPSMTRAALVASLSLLVGYVGRKFTPYRLISFVAMLTLLLNPSHLLNLGWQLSFASFFAILILAPRLTQTFYGGKPPPWLASMLLTSLATSLVCAPILIYNFGTLSLLSFVANLVILPTLPYAMLGMMLTGLLSPLPLISVVVARLTTLILDLHLWLVNFLSTKTAFILSLPSANPLTFCLYLPLICYLAYPVFKRFRRATHTSRIDDSKLSMV